MESASQGKAGHPRVSIGMPVYNGERFLKETLDSVLRQTYTDFVLYIADNASTDGTEAICRDYAARDSRIRYIRNPVNVGAAANYTRCFEPASSEYFRWQNADDTIEPMLIESCVKVLDEHPDVVLAYGKTLFINEHSQPIGPYDDNLHLPQDSAVDRYITCMNNIDLQHLMYGLIRFDVLKKIPLLKSYVLSDINLICEIALYGKFTEIPAHMFNCRVHEKAASFDMENKERLIQHWDPSKRRLVLQYWHSWVDHYGAILRAPISPKEKMRLFIYLLKWGYWRKQKLGEELRDYVRVR